LLGRVIGSGFNAETRDCTTFSGRSDRKLLGSGAGCVVFATDTDPSVELSNGSDPVRHSNTTVASE
jgi:hypothetical protein